MASRTDTPLPSGDWQVDGSRSHVEFTIRKLGAGTLRGRFRQADGTLAVHGGRTSASGTVRVASIDTGNDERDAHLCAPSFFGAESHPEIAFRSRAIVPDGEDRWRISGDLTIRDRRREVELVAVRPAPEHLRVRGEIDRRDFGLTWNRAIEATGAVGTRVGIELDLRLTLDRRAAVVRSGRRQGSHDTANRQAGHATSGGA